MPYADPILPPASESIGKGTPPFSMRDSSCSCQTLCTNRLSVLAASTSAPSALNSPYRAATAASSVGQTKVKSPG